LFLVAIDEFCKQLARANPGPLPNGCLISLGLESWLVMIFLEWATILSPPEKDRWPQRFTGS
jgi:hypothetical protein